MSKLIRRFLTDDLLREEFGGRYTGSIADVEMLRLHNRFRGEQVDEPTIRFKDDLLLVPNQRMRKALVDRLGKDTDGWRGSRVSILRQAIEYTDRKTGERRIRFEKRLAEDAPVAASRWPVEAGRDFTRDDGGTNDDDSVQFGKRRAR